MTLTQKYKIFVKFKILLILLIFLTFIQISKTLTQNVFFFCVRENTNCVRVFKIYCDEVKKFKKIQIANKY